MTVWFRACLVVTSLFLMLLSQSAAQEKSVKPGINDSFQDPNVKEFEGRFEVESREVFARRKEIVAACQLKPGQTVADIGAGTGLFTRLFAEVVGRDGRVMAVDIAPKFLEHIQTTSRAAGLKNVETVLCKQDSTELPAGSVDVAFICDTYHHFEFPLKTMTSLLRAMKPGGRVILIDFQRVEGRSSDWVMNHVRAGQDVFEAEVMQAGFQKTREVKDLLQENYFVEFTRPAQVSLHPLQFPAIAGYGGVVALPNAVEQPRAGAKVLLDVTADAKPGEVNKGLERAARLLNLYQASGHKAGQVQVAIVLHGEATRVALKDDAWKTRFGADRNPNLPLIRLLRQAGVELFVCGQALNYKGYPEQEVLEEVPVAAAALTVVINRHADGYVSLPIP